MLRVRLVDDAADFVCLGFAVYLYFDSFMLMLRLCAR